MVYVFLFLRCHSREDSYLLGLEADLRSLLLKINVCDALLHPNPPGRHVSTIASVEDFFRHMNCHSL